MPVTATATAAFADVYETLHDEISAAVEVIARTMPAIGDRAATLGEERMAEQRARYRELQSAVLRGGDDGPWLEALDAEGRAYARLGMSFADWMSLTRISRRVVRRRIADNPRQAEILDAMDAHFDKAIAAIGQSYVHKKEQMVAETQRHLDTYKALFDLAPMGVGMWAWRDRSTLGSFELLSMNPKGEEMRSHRGRDMVGKRFDEVFPELLRTDLPLRYARTIETGQPEAWNYTQTQTGRTIRVHAFPLPDDMVGAVFVDISVEQEALDLVEEKSRALESSNQELARFAYVASHDLRSPLRDLSNLAKWVRDDESEHISPESAQHLDTLCQRVSRMEHLLDDLLAYSRAGRRNEQQLAQWLDVEHLVREAAELVGNDDFPVTIVGSARLNIVRAPLEIVVRNLIDNAIKHHHQPKGHITITITSHDDRLRLFVDDDGPGIPEGYREQVFNMFETLRPRDEVEGSGMGLALARRLVTQRGGSIHLEDAPSGGCRFIVEWTVGEAA